MTREFGERESDPEFDAFFRRLLGKASRLRLPELFGGPPRDILYHLSNREISVVAVRATSLTHDQRGLTAATPRTRLAGVSWPSMMAMALLAGHMKKYRPDTIAAGEFKNSCLKIIDEVSKHGLPVTVTRRGKPLVRIVPARERSKRPSLKGTVVHEDADIFSTGESWDADR